MITNQVMQPLTGNFRAWLYWAETSLYGGEIKNNSGLSSEYYTIYFIFGPITLRVHDHLHKIDYLNQLYKADEVEITWALSDIVLFYCLKDKSAF